MRKNITPLLLSLALLLAGEAKAQIQLPIQRCATTEYMERLMKEDPGYRIRLEQMEKDIADYVQAQQKDHQAQQAVITIPTVVHIVYNTSSQNHTDASVQSQIDAMNADFRLMNSDKSSAPSVFQGLQQDSEIEFCLAQRDPSGNPTTGITRTQSSKSSFSTNDDVKKTSQGGKDPWPRDKYLNVWVCEISGGILGYAQFPGGSASTDGVVLHTSYFGTVNAQTPYHLGRTGTHEVGHWLGLYHIWGDSNCGNDQVSDTPTQQASNSGCPSFPNVTCSNGPNGDMYVNYMDYTNDACMVMFSAGQVSRMQGVLNGSRASLKTSDGCVPPAAPPVAGFDADNTTTCSGEVQFTDQSTVGPTSWNWSFGDGNGSTTQNPGHIYAANGTYTVKLVVANAYGQDSATKVSYITVAKPAAPSTTGDNLCGSGQANLSAGGSGTLNWYDAPNGGNLVYTGSNYTPTVSSTTTYYVEEVVTQPLQYGGPADNSFGTGAYFTANDIRGLLFDVNSAFTLQSVKVFSNSAGNRTIEVLTGDGGSVIHTRTMNIPAGESRVSLGFKMTPGTGYFIKVTGSLIDLYRNDSGPSYPYNVAGLASITASNASTAGYYYYFYDWEVQEPECISERASVTATVSSGSFNVTTSATDALCNGDCDGTAMVSASGGTGFAYQWDDAASQTGITATGLCAGTYNVTVTESGGCTQTEAVSVAEPSALTLSISGTDDSGSCDGTATATPSGGSPGYSYMWDDVSSQTLATATGLCAGIYNATVTDANGCAITQSVTVDLTTGLNGAEPSQGLILYPNPAGAFLHLKSAISGSATLTIYNTFGQTVLQREIILEEGKVQTIATETIAPGVYMVVIHKESESLLNIRLVIR